jgi:hypothetical protein
MKKLLIVALLSVQVASARLQVLDAHPQNVKLIKTLEMRFCYISFVEIDGKKYIIKQKKSDCLRKLVGVVRDAVMAHYAEGFINAHQVDVIPAGQEFVGKPRTDWPATIHTIAPGKMIKDQKSRFEDMNIKQAEVGFRRDMLAWMIKDPRLIKIVAYDTFHCNHDRHRGNLFYEPKSDSFCAIDMDSALKHNLCALACQNFTQMLHDKKLKLTKKEVAVLIEYNKYLRFLIQNHLPEDTLKTYDDFVAKAGFVDGAPFYIEKFVYEIAGNREMIMQSYEDVQELVKIVDRVIEKAEKSIDG